MNKSELLKIAKPILFNTEMVQAIIDNRKTVTRRVVKYYNRTPITDGRDKFYKIDENLNGNNPNRLYAGFYNDNDIFYIDDEKHIDGLYYPLYFKVGDILYVRETWCNINRPDIEPEYYYLADMKYVEDYDSSEWKWEPSIHMPKKATRIFLKVTNVRVERLQDITEEQAIREGVKDPYDYMEPQFYERPSMYKLKYHMAWESNPWVWVIEFERVKE